MSTAAIFDLDRTLISGSSTPVFMKELAADGITDAGENPIVGIVQRAMKTVYDVVGESRAMMQPAKLAVRANRGWSVADVETASKRAAKEVAQQLQPFAKQIIDEHREEGCLLVLASTSPIPFIEPLAAELGFDAAIGTRWADDGTSFTGELDGPFVWGPAKADAVIEWAQANKVRLGQSYAYSDSYYDSPLLDAVGHPTAVNPDPRLMATAAIKGWPVRHLDKSEGVIKVGGREIQEWTRPLMRPELVAPYADISFENTEKIPSEGAAIVVFNHRSYFDPTVMGLLIAKAGRNIRGLGKKEVFDVPIVGRLMRASGGIRVDRGTGSDEPLDAAIESVRGGELLMLAPEGTIPRGPAFFDPELKGRWGAARLAAETKAPVIPVGLWGTEKVWPRSSRLPRLSLTDRPHVTATVGKPVKLKYDDPDSDTKRIMKAISKLLPAEAREHRIPTEEELALTYPAGYRGDPGAETERRPGSDT